jgi:RimJ/RimL family protein N-acetyltransferase
MPLQTERLVIRPYRDDEAAEVMKWGSRNVAERCGMTLEGPGRCDGLDLLVYAREAP